MIFILLECLIFIVLLVLYFVAPVHISRGHLLCVISLAFSSYLLLYFNSSTKKQFRNNFLSNSNIFLILFVVVSFQFPLDYALGNQLIDFSKYFYKDSVINLSTAFNAMCLVSFVLGIMVVSVRKAGIVQCPLPSKKDIPLKPLLRIMMFCWVVFLVFLNPAYVKGGHGTVLVDNTSIAFYGYFWRLNTLYLAIDLINCYRIKECRINNFIGVLKRHPIYYWVVILISVALFFSANNRVYTLYLLVPTFFYFLSILKFKTKPLKSILVLGTIAVFFTLFKIYGIDKMFSDSSNLNVSELEFYDRFSSISPFTAELACSVLADSAMFYIWYTQGIVIFASTIVYGLLRVVSGLIPLFYMLTGLSDATYSSGSFITKQLHASYGLGSSVTGDMLISLGFVPTLIMMYIFGVFCYRSDRVLFAKHCGDNQIIIGLAIASQVAFVARASLCDVIATIIFCLLFFKIYLEWIKNKK